MEFTQSQKGNSLFNTAWSIARNASLVHGDSAKNYLGESLRITHARMKSPIGNDVLTFNSDLKNPLSSLGKFRGAVLSLKRNSFVIAETGYDRAEFLFNKKITSLKSRMVEFQDYPKVKRKYRAELTALTSRISIEKVLEITEVEYNWLSDLFYNSLYAKENQRGKEKEYRLSKIYIEDVAHYQLIKRR